MLARSVGLLQHIYTHGQAVTGTCCSWQRSQAGAWKQKPRLRNALGGVLLSRRCVIGGSLADNNNGNNIFYNNCCVSCLPTGVWGRCCNGFTNFLFLDCSCKDPAVSAML